MLVSTWVTFTVEESLSEWSTSTSMDSEPLIIDYKLCELFILRGLNMREVGDSDPKVVKPDEETFH